MIREIERITGLTVYPHISEALGECIVYSSFVLSDDGIKQQVKLNIRIITEHIPKSVTVANKIRNLLVTVGDNPNDFGYLQCVQNGGGQMLDNDTHMIHTILNFDLIAKSEVNI